MNWLNCLDKYVLEVTEDIVLLILVLHVIFVFMFYILYRYKQYMKQHTSIAV